MNEFTLAVLVTLRSLLLDAICNYENALTLNFSEWPNQTILLFTTAQFAASLENLPKHVKLFTLQTSETSNINKPNHFKSIEDLVAQLCDEIVQQYRLETHECNKRGELEKAKEKKIKLSHLYHKLRILHETFMTDSNLSNPLHKIELSLIWLMARNEDINNVEEIFGEFFSSCHSFSDEHQCHHYIVENEFKNIFLIIDTTHQQSIESCFDNFSNVKHIYYYGKSTNTNDKSFHTQDDLCYHLTYDLIGYYAELGDRYKANDQRELARDVFLKGQKLCKLLSKRFLSFE